MGGEDDGHEVIAGVPDADDVFDVVAGNVEIELLSERNGVF